MKTKAKTKKSAVKRFTITKNGKIRCSKKGRRHILVRKSSKSKRQKRTLLQLNKTDSKIVSRMLAGS